MVGARRRLYWGPSAPATSTPGWWVVVDNLGRRVLTVPGRRHVLTVPHRRHDWPTRTRDRDTGACPEPSPRGETPAQVRSLPLRAAQGVTRPGTPGRGRDGTGPGRGTTTHRDLVRTSLGPGPQSRCLIPVLRVQDPYPTPRVSATACVCQEVPFRGNSPHPRTSLRHGRPL